MDPQMKKGLLDPCVLAVIEKGDAYGYSLTQQTVALLGVSESSLYPVLRRLETARCLTVYSVEHNSRLRKYYAITDTGRQRIADFLAEYSRLGGTHHLTCCYDGDIDTVRNWAELMNWKFVQL